MSGIILSIGYVQEDNRLARDDCSFTTHHCLSSAKIPSAMAIYCSAFFDAQILNVRIDGLHQRINTKYFIAKCSLMIQSGYGQSIGTNLSGLSTFD
jgi:hypothetical protein